MSGRCVPMQAILRPAVVAVAETFVIGLFLLALGAARLAHLVGSIQAGGWLGP